jgi:hypothetical protein
MFRSLAQLPLMRQQPHLRVPQQPLQPIQTSHASQEYQPTTPRQRNPLSNTITVATFRNLVVGS